MKPDTAAVLATPHDPRPMTWQSRRTPTDQLISVGARVIVQSRYSRTLCMELPELRGTVVRIYDRGPNTQIVVEVRPHGSQDVRAARIEDCRPTGGRRS